MFDPVSIIRKLGHAIVYEDEAIALVASLEGVETHVLP